MALGKTARLTVVRSIFGDSRNGGICSSKRTSTICFGDFNKLIQHNCARGIAHLVVQNRLGWILYKATLSRENQQIKPVLGCS